MARKFLTDLDLNGNKLNNVALHPSGTTPSTNIQEGALWYDNNPGVKNLKVYNGTSWVLVASGGTSGVSSAAGTANQILVNSTSGTGQTGAVTLSLANDVTIPNNLTVTGNLTVSGTTTTVNSETVTINDNIVVLNNNAVHPPTENAGLRVYRGGTSVDASLLWDESTDLWKAGLAGSEVEISLLGHTHATYAPLASPTFTGTPLSTTAAVDTNTTQIATTAFVLAQAASTTSPMDGTAATGSSTRYARQDHVHPTDTSRAPLASPAFTGTPTAPTATAGTNSTQIATTAYVDSKKYTVQNTALTPTSGAVSWTVTHNLNTRDVMVAVYEVAAPYAQYEVDIERTTVNTITLRWNATATVAVDTYRVIVTS